MTASDDDRQSAAEYVLGTLPAQDRFALRARGVGEPQISALVQRWQLRLAPLHELAVAIAPPADLWGQIAAALPAHEAVAPQEEPADEVPPPAAVEEKAAPSKPPLLRRLAKRRRAEPAPPSAPAGEGAAAPPQPSPVPLPPAVVAPARIPSSLPIPEMVVEGATPAPAERDEPAPAAPLPTVSEPPAAADLSAATPPDADAGEDEEAENEGQAADLAADVAAGRAAYVPASSRNRWRVAAIVLGLALLGVGGAFAYREAMQAMVQPYLAILQKEQDGTVIVRLDGRTGDMVVRPLLEPAPDGKAYQLWLVSSRYGTRSLGTVNGAVAVRSDLVRRLGARALSDAMLQVTLEPEGRLSEEPTGEVVCSGRLLPQ